MSELLFTTPAFDFSSFLGANRQPRWQVTTHTPDGVAVVAPEGLRRLKAVIDTEIERLDRLVAAGKVTPPAAPATPTPAPTPAPARNPVNVEFEARVRDLIDWVNAAMPAPDEAIPEGVDPEVVKLVVDTATVRVLGECAVEVTRRRFEHLDQVTVPDPRNWPVVNDCTLVLMAIQRACQREPR